MAFRKILAYHRAIIQPLSLFLCQNQLSAMGLGKPPLFLSIKHILVVLNRNDFCLGKFL